MTTRPHPLVLGAIAAMGTILANMAQAENGYPAAHPDDGRVNEDAFVKVKTAAEAHYAAEPIDQGIRAADINGIPHHEYQRQREEERKWARQRALEMALGICERSPSEYKPEAAIALADKFYGYLYCGDVGEQPVNLASVPTEKLVAELGARVS